MTSPDRPLRARLVPRLLLGLALAFAILSVSPTLRALYAEYVAPPPLTFSALPIPVTGPVQAGQPVPLTVERCNTGNTPVIASFTRALVGQGDSRVRVALLSGTTEFQPGCEIVRGRATVVPEDTPPGIFIVEFVVTVQREGLRPWSIFITTEPFEVIP